MHFRILPLRAGYASGWVYPETGATLTFLMFAILGGPDPILVDTATYGPRQVRERQGLVLHRPQAEEPAAACRAAGFDPEDVRLILQTHLHWDHAGNARLFPNAELLVQREELRYAMAPPERDLALFDRQAGARTVWLDDVARMRLLDGDTRVAAGITALHLPGHTPGFQGFVVDTAVGPHLIAGDAVPTYAHWRRGAAGRRLVGPGADPAQMLLSLDRIEALGATVIPGHDDEVAEGGPIG